MMAWHCHMTALVAVERTSQARTERMARRCAGNLYESMAVKGPRVPARRTDRLVSAVTTTCQCHKRHAEGQLQLEVLIGPKKGFNMI